MNMYQNGVEVLILPDSARCILDELGRSPLDMNEGDCPLGNGTCDGNCRYYEE